MKTIERAHLPDQLWEKVKLPRNYQQALEIIDDTLEFWGKFQRHKCKQRLTKLHQMIIRQRKLKISDSHTMETQVRINKKYEKRETNREASALKAAQVERAIEKELLNRLKVGTFYKDIYNLDKKDFETKLDENEVEDQTQYEVDEENENEELDNSEDDSLLGGDLEIDEAERRMLELAEAEDMDELNQIENIDEKMLGKKRQKPVRIAMEQEIEYELEDEAKQKRQKVKNVIKPKKSGVVDF
jgi:protein MAK16